MKTLFSIFSFCILMTTIIGAQDVTTVEAKSTDISDNLDLEAVASIFSDAKDLEDFEKLLNDPETHISNLDLNEDGYVDYLRVIENANGDSHAITIQAVIGEDLYQDVATIDVEKDKEDNIQVQVVGNVYMYGPHYIIEPIYLNSPPVCLWFWGPRYSLWYSPYYWDYYPTYYHYWSPYTTVVYLNYIPAHIHSLHTYHYVTARRSSRCPALQQGSSRNDLARKSPERTFTKRNEGMENKNTLVEQRSKASSPDSGPANVKDPARKPVNKDWKPTSTKEDRPSSVKDGKVVAPTKEPTKPKPTNSEREDVKNPATKENPRSVKERAPKVIAPTQDQKTTPRNPVKKEASPKVKTPKTKDSPQKRK